MKKIFLFAAAFLLLCFLSSPFLSLILSSSLRDHTYREIMMHVIVRKQTRGIKDPAEAARKLFYFSAKYTLQNPGNLAPYDDKALGYLINGAVYCDYTADILAVLCAHRGIPARYCMLMDKDGVSPHTITEVFLDGKWSVFDAAEFYYYSSPGGGIATLDELSAGPGIIFGHKRMQKIRELRPDEYRAKCGWYKKIFPLPHPPQRSKSKIKKITVFDRVGFFYYDLFGKNFLRLYQDAYLDIFLCRDSILCCPSRDRTMSCPYNDRGSAETDKARALYYRAKSYQLTMRSDEAIKAYDELLRLYPNADVTGKARIFYSFIYMDDLGDLRRAIETLAPLAADAQSLYAKYALYYTGACYRALGESDKAREYFDRSGIAVYLDPEMAN